MLEELVIEVAVLGSLIILADLNADLHGLAWPSRLLRKALALGGMKVPSITPTRVCATSSTCLDIIALPDDIQCAEYSVVPIAASDHYLVEASLIMSPTVSTQPVIKRSFKRVDAEAFRQRASLIELDTSDTASADDMLNEWNCSITNLLDEFAPLKAYPICKKKCNWLTTECRSLMLQRDALSRRIAEDPSPTEEMVEECRKLKRRVKSRMRRASREYGSSMLASGESGRAWEFIRAATFSSAKGERGTTDLNILNDAFAEVVINLQKWTRVVPASNLQHRELSPV